MRRQLYKWFMRPVTEGDFMGCVVRLAAFLLVGWGVCGVLVYAGLKLILWATL